MNTKSLLNSLSTVSSIYVGLIILCGIYAIYFFSTSWQQSFTMIVVGLSIYAQYVIVKAISAILKNTSNKE